MEKTLPTDGRGSVLKRRCGEKGGVAAMVAFFSRLRPLLTKQHGYLTYNVVP